MPKITIPLANMTPTLSDASVNDYYALFLEGLTKINYRAEDVDAAPPDLVMSKNRKKMIIRGVANDDMPSISRMVAIDTLLTGAISVEGVDLMLGLTNAKLTQDCELVPGKKWNQICGPGTNYPIDVWGDPTPRNWISTGCVSPAGLDLAQIKTIRAASGIQIKTLAQYRTDRPVTPLP